MKSVRERVEEIWPVPEGVYWSADHSCYGALPNQGLVGVIAYNARLDTFTRCQETTDVYVSLVDELISALDHHLPEIPDSVNKEITGNLVDRAKQIMEQIK